MLNTGLDGFKGDMTAKKYMALTNTSKSTATRDLLELVEVGLFLPVGGSRSIHCILNLGFLSWKKN